MMPSYLKEDCTGSYSGIEYAKKGDIVYIIGRSEPNMVLVTNQNALKFYIHESKLSNQPVEKDINIVTTKPTKRKVR